ncbi:MULTISPECIES: hypothetical protein [unclassified Dyella]|uniref:hypothetical protein n=1 Tax=unclassified Dyella TaxID=2634549 RepID=UPI003F8E49F3
MHVPRLVAPLLLVGAMLVSLAACATPAGTQAESRRPLRVVNATFDGVTALAIAPSGSADFQNITLAQPLPGGQASILVDVPPGTCHRDVRVTFRGDRSLLYRNLDVCRHDGLRLAVGSTRTGRSTPLKSDDAQMAGSP